MKPRELLEMEAELQRQTLRTEVDSLRRRRSELLKEMSGGSLAAMAVSRMVPGLLGRRAPWVVYGWLAFKIWRALNPPLPRKRLRVR